VIREFAPHDMRLCSSPVRRKDAASSFKTSIFSLARMIPGL
jgi:hypothetical protein